MAEGSQVWSLCLKPRPSSGGVAISSTKNPNRHVQQHRWRTLTNWLTASCWRTKLQRIYAFSIVQGVRWNLIIRAWRHNKRLKCSEGNMTAARYRGAGNSSKDGWWEVVVTAPVNNLGTALKFGLSAETVTKFYYGKMSCMSKIGSTDLRALSSCVFIPFWSHVLGFIKFPRLLTEYRKD